MDILDMASDEPPKELDDGVRRLVAGLNEGRDDELRLRHRFAVGDGAGAYAVDRAGAGAAVLKWWPNTPRTRSDRALRLPRIDRLRQLGWPIPVMIESGETNDMLFELWEVAAGQPVVGVLPPPAIVEGAVGLVHIARGAALGDGQDWPIWIDVSVRRSMGKARPKAGVAGKDILDGCRQAMEVCTLPPGRDIIHGDFTPANCLVENSRLSAIVDFDECRDGDGSLDLMGMLWDLVGWNNAGATGLDALQACIQEMVTPEQGRVLAAYWIAGSLAWAAGTEHEHGVVEAARRVFQRFPAKA